jgi:hypothetical protein
LQNMEIDDDQMRAALDLADAAAEIAGGQTPCMQDPDAWFPEKSNDSLPGYHGLHKDNGARELCLTQCEIVLQCRAYALKHHEMSGVWGGLSYYERKLIWSQQAQQTTQSRKGIRNRRH